MSLFDDSRSRFNRAILHVKAFDAEWKRIVHPNSYDIVTESNSNWTEGITKAVRKVSSENSLALELGEFFYQLRAALDALIYQAAIFIEDADPPSCVEGLYFPMCKKPTSFKNSPIYTLPFPRDLLDWLELMQPYRAEQTTDTETREIIRILSVINTCAKIDRHRHLHIVAAVPTNIRITYAASPPSLQVVNIKLRRVNFLESEFPFVTFNIRGANLRNDNRIKLKTDLRLEISVAQIPVPDGETLHDEIYKMLSTVDYIIGSFERGFSHGQRDISPV